VIIDNGAYVLRHRSGRYLNALAHFVMIRRVDGTDSGCHDPSHPMAVIHQLVPDPFTANLFYAREHWDRYMARPEWISVADQFAIVPAPGCACCGSQPFWDHAGQRRRRG